MTQTNETPQKLHYKAIITDELLARMKAHVFVVFWPVLYLNLLYIKCWVSLCPVKGNAYVAVRFSVFGQIQLKYGGQLFYEDGPELTDLETLEALPSWDRLQAALLKEWMTVIDLVGRDNIPPCLRPDAPWRDVIPPRVACAWGVSGKKLDPGWLTRGHPSTSSG